jgi:hypothetical protein
MRKNVLAGLRIPNWDMATPIFIFVRGIALYDSALMGEVAHAGVAW